MSSDEVVLILQFGVLGIAVIAFFRGDIISRPVHDKILGIYQKQADDLTTKIVAKMDIVISEQVAANDRTIVLIERAMGVIDDHDSRTKEAIEVIPAMAIGIVKLQAQHDELLRATEGTGGRK